jgi:acetyl esterase
MKLTEKTLRQPIDPALRQYLDALQASAPAPRPMSDAERAALVRASMVQALERRDGIKGLPNAATSEDLTIGDHLGARLYRPSWPQHPALMVYFHGGGWVGGSVATHDPFCRLLAEAAGVALLSVEYRLAPESPFPAPLEDALHALSWAAAHASGLGFDGLAIGGDSAGANLAAVAANRLGGSVPLRAQMLLYPVTDHPAGAHASYADNATGYGLEAASMRWFWQQYAPGASPDNADLAPLRQAQFPSLPPTLVATTEYDVLRDEGIAYAARLAQAGVLVTHLHAADMQHNFPATPGTVMRFPQSEATLEEIAAWLRAVLEKAAADRIDAL